MGHETNPKRGQDPFPDNMEKGPDTFSLDDYIERYESAQAREGRADLVAFLPNRSDPLYLPVLRELVRVDLEYSWQRGQPTPLQDYLLRFPELFEDLASLQAISFEEYRLRKQ